MGRHSFIVTNTEAPLHTLWTTSSIVTLPLCARVHPRVCLQRVNLRYEAESSVNMSLSLWIYSPHRLAACVLKIKITAPQTHISPCGLNTEDTHVHTCSDRLKKKKNAPARVLSGCGQGHPSTGLLKGKTIPLKITWESPLTIKLIP